MNALEPELRAGAAARAAAAGIVAAVLGQGESLSAALPDRLAGLASGSERGLAQELAYGSLRFHFRLKGYLDRLLDRPLKPRDADVHALLLIGLYQLHCLNTPPHVAVDTTVSACSALGKAWAGGLVNAVLRNYLRRRAALESGAGGTEEEEFNHPAWLVTALRSAWPEDWRNILAANDARPPLCLRVNTRRTGQSRYLLRLADAGLAATAAAHAPEGIRLHAPVGVSDLPGFAEGDVSVQDEAAQLAAHLLDPLPGQRALDACAAPGGKAAHLLELQPRLETLVAVEKDPARLRTLQSTLARLHLQADVRCADAGQPDRWWDGAAFDRILLDAPCSATGVIRRHPDIKLLRRPEDLAETRAAQARLLDALWPLLRAGGKLLYATCSVLPVENQHQIENFMQRTRDAEPLRVDGNWGRDVKIGRQILPGEDGMDGFYYALLRKH